MNSFLVKSNISESRDKESDHDEQYGPMIVDRSNMKHNAWIIWVELNEMNNILLS